MKSLLRLWWIYQAAAVYWRVCGWSISESWRYAESLHHTYVVEDDDAWSPYDAIEADFSNWGDSHD